MECIKVLLDSMPIIWLQNMPVRPLGRSRATVVGKMKRGLRKNLSLFYDILHNPFFNLIKNGYVYK